eukprot:3010979-Rhodomonas_salina.2
MSVHALAMRLPSSKPLIRASMPHRREPILVPTTMCQPSCHLIRPSTSALQPSSTRPLPCRCAQPIHMHACPWACEPPCPPERIQRGSRRAARKGHTSF